MHIHGPTHIHGPQPINAPHRTQGALPTSGTDHISSVDELDISREAELISRSRDVPEIRADRVAEIRSQIEMGTYDTDEKLEIAVGRLLDEMSG